MLCILLKEMWTLWGKPIALGKVEMEAKCAGCPCGRGG